MSNATENTTAAEVELEAPSDKAINYFINTFVDENSSVEENYRNLIKSVWGEARKPSTKKPSINELVTDQIFSSYNLAVRIEETRTVIRNTLRKMTHGYPDEFRWAMSRFGLRVFDIVRPGAGWNRSDLSLKNGILAGTHKLNGNDVVKFGYHDSRTAEFSIQLKYLQNDPIAVAQMVRTACRNHAAKEENKVISKLQQERKDLEAQLEKANKALEQAKQAKTIKPRSKKK